MAANDPTLLDLILRPRDWARGEAAPYLAWLPDSWEPYALDFVACLLLFAAVVGIAKKGKELWSAAIWVPRGLWRLVTGHEPPMSESARAAAAAEQAASVVERTEQKVDGIDDILRALLAKQAEQAEERGEELPEDALERAVAAVREVLASNDPAKAEAQDALRAGDVRAAEDALAGAFERVAEAYARMSDVTQQVGSEAARTAREKAALAATRSVADALIWYRKAAELEPEDFWTLIELARLHRVAGNLAAALEAAEAALRAAREDRSRSVARNEIGDVFVEQGDLGKALESYQASHAIFERLARADASNAGLQRDLSVSHERIGDLHETWTEIANAISAYEASLQIAQSLADRFPDHPQFQSDLEITKRRLGELRARLR